MTPFNEQLLNIDVISEDRIKEIREQLNIQYQSLSSKEKANMLARTIHQMIDHSLPDFSHETKKRIRMELMSKKLSANSLSISANDIIESSIELATREELGNELLYWVNEKTDTTANLAELTIDEFIESFKEAKVINTYKTDILVQPIQHNDENNIPIKNDQLKRIWPQRHRLFFLGGTAIILLLFIIIIYVERSFQSPMNQAREPAAENKSSISNQRMPNELPSYFQYEQVDDKKLKAWLIGRNSILAEEPYFSSIIKAASEFNIHPLLLFAITGQEQGFVSKNHANAEKIANNPFNVFHSWEDFNTSISESSRIAARTIVNVSKGRPKEADPIQWINRKYAEDPNWWVGVSSIYKQLKDVVQ